ncbi:MAG: hypothetical protein R2720_03395 [Candidatus Nanopelagicales bacterium]
MFDTSILRSPAGREVHLPIPVTVRRTPQYVAIVEPITGIHGVGSSGREAMRDFWIALAQWNGVIGEEPTAPNLRQMRVVLDRLLSA